MKSMLILYFCTLILWATTAHATSNHEYGVDEYVTITHGLSPDGKYAITTHGEGDLGYKNFHIYLTNAVTGKKVGPLEEIVTILDTGAGAYCAQWSKNSERVTIIYRISRHEPLRAISYRLGKGRAFLIEGPVNATHDQEGFWSNECSTSQPSERVFGTSRAPVPEN